MKRAPILAALFGVLTVLPGIPLMQIYVPLVVAYFTSHAGRP